MADAAGVRRLAIEAGHGVGIVHHRGIHHLDGAATAHLDMLGEIDLTHSSFPELFHDVIAVRDDLTHEIARRRGGSQRLPVIGTELHVIGVFGGTDGADLHARIGPPPVPPPSSPPGSSIRSSLSPTMMREPCCNVMAPRAAIATPLRLWSSTSTKSASSDRTVACCALIEGS